MNKFWQRCVDLGCVVVPLKVYSQYTSDGNIGEEYFIGVRYAAVALNDEATGPEYFWMLETGSSGDDCLFETPDEALEAFEKAPDEYHKIARKQPKRKP